MMNEQEGGRTPVPLSMVPTGSIVTIKRINAGRGLMSRLSAMGLLPGARVSVVRSATAGPVVVKVLDSKVVLGRGMAHKVFVVT